MKSEKRAQAAKSKTVDLRKLAEKITRGETAQSPESIAAMSSEEMGQALHELRVHQLELEMQNEELRQSREHLESARTKYFDLYDLAPVGYVTLSAKGLILEANLAAANLWGVARSALMGERFSRFILTDDQDIYYRIFKEGFKTDKAQACEVRIVKKDKTIFWAQMQLTSSIGEGGATIFKVVLSDISEHKLMEISLRQSEGRFRKMFEDHTAAKLIIDPENGSIIGANAAAAQFYGWSIEELQQMRIHQINTLPAEVVAAEMRKAATLGRVKFEFEHRMADDSVRDVEVFSNAIIIDGKAILHSIIHDITDRKQAEKALQESHDLLEQRVEERTKELRESKVRLQLAISAADIAISELDIAGNHITWDETSCRFYGIPSDIHVGSYAGWEARIHPEDRPMVEEAHLRALRGDGEFAQDYRIVWPDKSIHWMKASSLLERDPKGRPLRFIISTLDITKDKLLLEAAEAANRAKGQFMGNMSHELRTPLNGVIGMTDLLLSTPLTDKQRDYAGKIKKSGEALRVVVSNILDFSKLDTGKVALEGTPFFVEAVIANVTNLFGPAAAQEKIGLYTAIDPAIPALRGDSQRLTQVMSNLVGNAVKFTKSGEIRVAVKILRQTGAMVDLEISVQDTGIGMTPEEISKLFTAFTQADDSNTRRYGGTGLGLAISRNLVELMGGTLKVESVLSQGSVFTIHVSFPIASGIARSDLKFAPINPVTPDRPELPPGDMAELKPLLEQLEKPLASREPLPCKEILAGLLQKKWPEEQETLLLELNRLVNLYRLPAALELLNKYEAGGA